MKLHQRPDFWPWVCGLLTCVAMTLGLAADGVADVIAALLLCVPPVVVIRGLIRSRQSDDRSDVRPPHAATGSPGPASDDH